MPLDKYKKDFKRREPEPLLPGHSKSKKSLIGLRVFMFLFGLIFFVVGCVAVWQAGIKTTLQTSHAAEWPAVRARILHSDVATHSDSDGTTYSFEVRYAYEFKGKPYESSRYKFSKLSTSDYSSMARIRDHYGVGHLTTAYVNPDDPYSAVLNRKLELDDMFGFVFLLFNIFGVVIMVGAISASDAVIRPKN